MFDLQTWHIPSRVDGIKPRPVVCREIHVSVTKERSVRRVALMPIMVNGKHISEFFNGLRSPALMQMDSSCDFMVSFIF